MARARNLKPSFFHDAELLECDFWVRILFEGLWCYADRRGILADNLKQIKLDVFPGDAVDIEEGLAELVSRGFIERYEANGKRCIQIRSFERHQNPHKDEKPNDLPFKEEHRTDPVLTPDPHRADPAITITTPNLSPEPLTTEPDGAPAALSSTRYSTVFEVFWVAWQVPPSKNHGGKKEAYDAWKALGLDGRGADVDRQAVLDGLHGWQACGRWLNGYVRDCHRWLKARNWADEPPDDPPKNGRPDPNDQLIRDVDERTPEEQARLDAIWQASRAKQTETAEERWARLHPEQAAGLHILRSSDHATKTGGAGP